ncbi:MAG: hypothetical protein ACOYN4_19140, partial [Bacteroidales bacterium]
ASTVLSGVVTQLKDYTQTTDVAVTNDIVLDLDGYTFSGTNASTISSGKMFGLKNSGATGNFDAGIKFGNGTAVLQLLPGISFGANFTTENSSETGKLQIGDGITAFSLGLQNGDVRFSKVSQVKLKNLASASLSPSATGIPFDFVLDDGAILKLASTGTYPNTISSTTTGAAATAILQIGDISAITASFTGTLTEYYGEMHYYNGSTLNLDLAISSTNPFITTLGGSSTATSLVKKGGFFTLGQPSSDNNFELSPHGVLDLGNVSNTGRLAIQGNLNIIGFNDPNAGKIKFKFTKSGETISTNGLSCFFGSILTDDLPSYQIDVSKHFVFDLDNLTGVSGTTYQIEIATVGGPIAFTGTPVPINAAPGWQDFSVTSGGGAKGTGTAVYFNATYLPCANPSNGGEIEAAQAICLGSPAAPITNKTLPTGQTGTREYQWQSSSDSISYTNLSTGTYSSTTYSPDLLTATTWFRRLTRVGCMANWTGAISSNTVKVTIYPIFASGSINKSGETICYSGNPTQIGDSISASGGDGAISYQWQSSTDNLTYSDISTGTYTTTTYTPVPGLTETTWYRRMAKDGTCNTSWATSLGEWKEKVYDNFNAGIIGSVGAMVCYGGDPDEIVSETDASGGDGNISYQWWSSTTNGKVGFTEITGATAKDYNPPAGLTVTTWYRRSAKDGTCNT